MSSIAKSIGNESTVSFSAVKYLLKKNCLGKQLHNCLIGLIIKAVWMVTPAGTLVAAAPFYRGECLANHCHLFWSFTFFTWSKSTISGIPSVFVTPCIMFPSLSRATKSEGRNHTASRPHLGNSLSNPKPHFRAKNLIDSNPPIVNVVWPERPNTSVGSAVEPYHCQL
jgi:hypothetical protein